MEKKIPQQWAKRLADLHNLVMELQDEFDTIKSDLYCGEDIEENDLSDYDIDKLTEEIESICDRLDDIECEASELDYEYNDYD